MINNDFFFLQKLDIGPGRRQGFVERRLKGGDAAGRQVHLSMLLELVPRIGSPQKTIIIPEDHY